MPTRKWWAATITAATGLTVMLLTGDPHIDGSEVIAIVTFASQRLIAWVTSNEKP